MDLFSKMVKQMVIYGWYKSVKKRSLINQQIQDPHLVNSGWVEDEFPYTGGLLQVAASKVKTSEDRKNRQEIDICGRTPGQTVDMKNITL